MPNDGNGMAVDETSGKHAGDVASHDIVQFHDNIERAQTRVTIWIEQFDLRTFDIAK